MRQFAAGRARPDSRRRPLCSQPGDEEPGGPVDMREREKALGAPRMAKVRPAGAEIVERKPERGGDVLVLGRVNRADGVGDRAARSDALDGRAQEAELELRERLRPPTQVWPRVEHAQAGAGRVHERPVELTELWTKVERVGAQNGEPRRPEALRVLLQLACPPGVFLDGHDLRPRRGE